MSTGYMTCPICGRVWLEEVIARHYEECRAEHGAPPVGMTPAASELGVDPAHRRRRRELLVAVVVVVALVAAIAAVAPRARKRVRYLDATMRVDIETCAGSGNGSGFLAGPRTLITNQHVVERATAVSVVTFHGDRLAVDRVEIVADADIGIVHLREDAEPVLFLAPIDPDIGESIHTSGYPGAGRTTQGHVRGYVEPHENDDTVRYLVTDAEGAPGISGGPLLNDANQVVGLIFGGHRLTDDTYAIPATDLAWALESRNRVPVDLGRPCTAAGP